MSFSASPQNLSQHGIASSTLTLYDYKKCHTFEIKKYLLGGTDSKEMTKKPEINITQSSCTRMNNDVNVYAHLEDPRTNTLALIYTAHPD